MKKLILSNGTQHKAYDLAIISSIEVGNYACFLSPEYVYSESKKPYDPCIMIILANDEKVIFGNEWSIVFT